MAKQGSDFDFGSFDSEVKESKEIIGSEKPPEDSGDFNFESFDGSVKKKESTLVESIPSALDSAGSTSELEGSTSASPQKSPQTEIPTLDPSTIDFKAISADVENPDLQDRAPQENIATVFEREGGSIDEIVQLGKDKDSISQAIQQNNQSVDNLNAQLQQPGLDEQSIGAINEEKLRIETETEGTKGALDEVENRLNSLSIRERYAQPESELKRENSDNAVEGFFNTLERGFMEGEVVDILALGRQPTSDEIERIAEIKQEQAKLPSSKAYNDYLKAESVSEQMDKIWSENFADIMGSLVGESLATMVRHGSSRAAAGAAIGSVVPGVGTATGAIAGMAVAGYSIEMSASILESLKEAGIDPSDPESLKKGFANEELMDAARSHASKRAIPIALFDLVSMGIGGKIVGSAAKPFIKKALLGTAEVGVQLALAGAGEATAQKISTGELRPTEIFNEMIGELGGGSVDIAIGISVEAKKVGKDVKKQLSKIGVSKEEFNDSVDISKNSGQITKVQAEEIKQEYSDIQDAKEVTPKEHKENPEIVVKLSEKRDLDSQLEGIKEQESSVDESFRDEFEGKKAAIEEKRAVVIDEIKKLQETSKEEIAKPKGLNVAKKGVETEYKSGEQFLSEKEIVEALQEDEFVESVKDGNSNLSISNPSEKVSQALEDSGLTKKSKVEVEIKSETKTNQDAESKKTKDTETKTESKETVLEETPPVEEDLDLKIKEDKEVSETPIIDQESSLEGAAPIEPKEEVEGAAPDTNVDIEDVSVKSPSSEIEDSKPVDPITSDQVINPVVESNVEVEKTPDIPSKKEKTSKGIERAIFNEKDPETKAKIEELGKFQVLDVKSYVDLVDKVISDFSVEGAIEYARTLSNDLSDGSARKKQAILLTAGGLKKNEASVRKSKAKESGDLEARAAAENDIIAAYQAIAEGAKLGTEAGQVNAVVAEIHKKFPSLYMVNALNSLESSPELSNTTQFKDENGSPISVEDAIESIRETLKEEIRRSIEADLGAKIEGLEEKIKELQNQKPKPTPAAKKAEIKKNINKNWGKLKTAGRGSASASFIGLNNAQIEILGEIVVDYVKLGGLSAQQIVNKVTREAKGIIDGIEKDHVEAIAMQLGEFNEKIAEDRVAKLKKAEEGSLTDKEASEITREAEKLTGKKIKEIVSDHYINRDGVAKTLAESLIEGAGLDIETAKGLAESIEGIISEGIEAKVKVELDKFVESTKEKDPSKRVNKKLSDKIVKAINIGALSKGDIFQQAFESKFGFKTIDQRSKARMVELIEQLTIMENNNTKTVEVDGVETVLNTTKRSDVQVLQKEFNTLLESSKKLNTAIILKEISGGIYVSILSNPTSTSVKAIIGSLGGASFGVAAQTLQTPVASFLGIIEAAKSSKTSFQRAGKALRTGSVEVGKTKTMGEFSGDRQSRVESVIFQNVRSAIKNKEYGKAAIALYGTTLKNVRILAAMDAFLVSQSGVYFNTVSEVETRSKKNGIDDRMSKNDLNIIYDDIAKEEFNDIKSDVESDVSADIKNGLTKESQRSKEVNRGVAKKIGASGFSNLENFYTNIRSQELKENQNFESFQKAWAMGQYFSLVGKPDGYAGMALTEFNNALQIKDTDTVGKAAGKFAGNMVFKFVNLMGNSLSATLGSVPVLGILNAYLGAGFNPLTGEYDTNFFKGKIRANKRLVHNKVAANAITTGLTALALFDQLDWDDEEEKFALNPDRKMDFRASGFRGLGGLSKSKKQMENFEPFSFSWTKDKDGNFSNYKNHNIYIPQLNAVVSTVGALTDDLKGLERSGKIQKREEEFFAKGVNVFNQNMLAFTQASFSSIGRIIKPFMYEDGAAEGATVFVVNTLSDNISPLLKPNSHIAVSRYIESSAGAPKREARTVGERLIKDFYGLDNFILSEKTDAFGNPLPEENDIERFVTGVEKMSEKHPKTVGLLYKFDERGVEIGKWRASELKSFSEGFSFGGRKYRAREDLRKEALKEQEAEFNKIVTENFDKFNSIKSVELLEKALKRTQKRTKDMVKRRLIKKYLDVNDKKAKIVRVN